MKRFSDQPFPMDQLVANRRDIRDDGLYYSMLVIRDGRCMALYEIFTPKEAVDRGRVAHRLRRARALRACLEPDAE